MVFGVVKNLTSLSISVKLRHRRSGSAPKTGSRGRHGYHLQLRNDASENRHPLPASAPLACATSAVSPRYNVFRYSEQVGERVLVFGAAPVEPDLRCSPDC